MATVIQKGDGLKEKYLAHRKRGKIGLLVMAVGFAATALCVLVHIPVISYLTMLVFLGGGMFAAREWREATIVGVGLSGEQMAVSLVRRLPDTYTVFRNLTVEYEGKTSEMDLVVVGPSGVFVIEVKNHNGTIRGSREAKMWTQHKVGQGGTPYHSRLYSPVKQVRTHVYCLAGILEMADIRVFVRDGVFFTNPDTRVELMGTSTRTPVFVASEDGARELYGYLLHDDGRFNPELCGRVVERLKAL